MKLLQIGSTCWSTASQWARLAAKWGWLPSTQLNTRVVSVGNIQVGGAGKTPLVALIAKEAIQKGLNVCILCRGYRSRWETQGGEIYPSHHPVKADQCGDEAALLHDLVPEAFIGVGRDRVKQYHAIQRSLTQQGSKIHLVILDDGFQHWKIQKNLEIVALTSATSQEMLFRDSIHALQFADLLVWTKGPLSPQQLDLFPKLKTLPQVRTRYRLKSMGHRLDSGKKSLWLVTGVANGSSVFSLVQETGYLIQKHIQFKDHAYYTHLEIQNLLKHSQQANCSVAITGKDWVKWRDHGVRASEVLVLEPEIVFEEGRDVWNRVLWGT